MSRFTEQQVRAAATAEQDLYTYTNRSATRAGQPELSLEELLKEIERNADLPLEEGRTLPAQAYTSQEFFDWEVENVFRAEWYCLAHVSQIPEIGDFINVEVFGDPLIVIRDKSNQIQALSRSCPHRGMDIMPPGFGYDGHGPAVPAEGKPGCGNTRLLLCPYHSWTFDLDGSLKACPEMQEAKGFCRSDVSLASYRCQVWQGFIFVNLDGKAEKSVSEQYAGLSPHLEKWNLDEFQIVVEREWDCPFNWKVLTENFMESYHHAGAHSKTLQPMMPARDTWNEEERAHYIRCHLPFKEALRDEIRRAEASGEQWDVFPPRPGLEGEDRFEWGLILGFPIFTFLLTPDSAVWYRIQPLGPNRLKLLTTVLAHKSAVEGPGFEEQRAIAEKNSIDFHLEDMEVCCAVHRSMYSHGFQRGRLSHLEMSIWQIQRYLAARSRGTWPTLDRPAAKAQTHSHV